MGLGGILQELKREGVLLLYNDYRSGRSYDWSGNGNAPSLGYPIYFTKQGMSASAATYPTLTNNAGLQAFTTGTIIGRIKTFVTSPISYISYKSGQVMFSHNATTGQINLASNLAVVVAASPGGGTSTHAVDFDSAGGVPKYFLNGVFVSNMSGGLSIVSNANNVQIITTNSSSSTIGEYLLYITRKLTATEHARVYAQLENMTWNTKGLAPGPMMP